MFVEFLKLNIKVYQCTKTKRKPRKPKNNLEKVFKNESYLNHFSNVIDAKLENCFKMGNKTAYCTSADYIWTETI